MVVVVEARMAALDVGRTRFGLPDFRPFATFHSPLFSSIFRIETGAADLGVGTDETGMAKWAPTNGVRTDVTRGGAATPVVVVGRHEKIQQEQIQNRLVFPVLSVEMKKIIVDDETLKCYCGRRAEKSDTKKRKRIMVESLLFGTGCLALIR